MKSLNYLQGKYSATGITGVFFDLDTGRRTRGHSVKLHKPHCHKDIRKYFFSLRVINRWNSLPEEVVLSSSINSFKSHLQRIRETTMGFLWTNVCQPSRSHPHVRPHLVSLVSLLSFCLSYLPYLLNQHPTIITVLLINSKQIHIYIVHCRLTS